MHSPFQRDFWNIARENKGYYGWTRQARWRLYRALHRRHHKGCMRCDEDWDPADLVQSLFEHGLGLHPLLDIAFEAFARAEARLSLRFVPQRSHEERLTGHLISELEAAILMAADSFSAAAASRYKEQLYLDFVYSDLSRGGHFEKATGGDFGLILVIDLPDRPKVVRCAAIQAKRLQGSTSLDKVQFDTLNSVFGQAATYLFYDCDFNTLAPPMVMRASYLESQRNSKEDTKTFAVDQSYVFGQGLPLTLWLLTELGTAQAGESAYDFESAMNRIMECRNRNQEYPLTRLAIVSIGSKFSVTPDNERGLRITL